MSVRSGGWVSCVHVALWCCLIGVLGWVIGGTEKPVVATRSEFFPQVSGRFPTVPLPTIIPARMEKLLATPVDVQVDDEPLRDVVKTLATGQGIAVRFEEPAFADDRESMNEAVSLHLKQVSLRNVLNLLLHPRKLEWVVEDSALLVTTQFEAEERLETHYYPLPDLHDKDTAQWEGGPIDNDSVIELITSTVAPDSWEEVGGRGLNMESGGGFLICNTQAVHTELNNLYRQIERLISRSEGSDYPAQPGETFSAAEAAIITKLEQPLGVTFTDIPLVEAMRLIAKRHGINIWIDEASLIGEEIATDANISAPDADVSMRAALLRMLDEWQLTYVVEDGVLKITTEIVAEMTEQVRVYDVRRIILDEDYDSIIYLITSIVPPDSWGEMTGPGPLTSLPGMIAIRQVQYVHHEIAQLLYDIERIQTTPRRLRPAEAPLNRARRAEARLREQLRKPVSIDVRRQPLVDVLQSLARQHDLPIWLDEINCAAEKISTNAPITAQLSDIPLKDCLSSILEPLKLKAVYDSEHLRVTSKIVADEELLTTRVYHLVDLLEAHAFGDPKELMQNDPFRPTEGGKFFQVHDSIELASLNRFQGDEGMLEIIEPYVPDLKQLALDSAIEKLQQTVAPKAWDFVGGPGSIAGFNEVLAIRHTDEVHEKIAQWLAKLRRDLHR